MLFAAPTPDVEELWLLPISFLPSYCNYPAEHTLAPPALPGSPIARRLVLGGLNCRDLLPRTVGGSVQSLNVEGRSKKGPVLMPRFHHVALEINVAIGISTIPRAEGEAIQW